jgi:seryl-tRNA synthetase
MRKVLIVLSARDIRWPATATNAIGEIPTEQESQAVCTTAQAVSSLMSRSRIGSPTALKFVRFFTHSSRQLENIRPTTAPKQHPDIAHIRDNVELHEKNALLRNYTKHQSVPSQIAAHTQRISEINTASRKPRVQIKALQAQLTSKSADRSKVLQEIKRLKPVLDKLVKEGDELEDFNRSLALALPNLTSAQTPTDGKEKVLSYIQYDPEHPPTFDKSADHSSIGEKLALIDFTSASMASGWGFYYLLNEAALLEQALVQYALSVAMKYGWRVAAPPSLVYSHTAEACGFQPRDQNDEQQIWQIAQSAKDEGKPKRSLAGTAEIPLAGLNASKDIREQHLPLKLVGSSRCYRAEAGARGVDTKGLYRVHEFTKVEMFAWADSPGHLSSATSIDEWVSKATEVFDEMVHIQTEILSSLGLPCRVLEMPSSDLGASAYRKIDIEALFPSRLSRDGGWGEVTSVSICTDYQSRRLDTRVLSKSGSRSKFTHTINGTAAAIPRVLAAILEHGWRAEEQCVVIPEVLRPYMGGIEKIQRKS